ncbi:MAG: PilN domain-containing protein [Hyphomicrobiaceae bacterium]|nr:PilN domain-containing protein [Hyphomicrobiaceae bacterium]
MSSAFGQFLSWWGEELRQLVPPRLGELMSGSEPRIILSIEPDGLRLLKETGAHRTEVLRGADCAETWSAVARTAHVAAGRKASFGIRLPLEACLVRNLELPKSAQRDVAQILGLDLERSTPFRQKDVYTAYHVEQRRVSAGRIGVRQVIVSRSRVDPVIERLRQLGCAVSFADCWSENQDGPALPVDLLASANTVSDPAVRPVTAVRLLAGAAIALTASGTLIYASRHDRALQQIGIEVQQARTRAQQVRASMERSDAAVEELESLHRMKRAHPSALVILEELTRVLPDSAWITELRFDGEAVELAGVATSAATLLPVLERSGYFTHAALTSPLTLIQSEDRERFSIRMRVSGGTRQREPESDGGKG